MMGHENLAEIVLIPYYARLVSQGLLYQPRFVPVSERSELMRWLDTLHPLWEKRFSTKRDLPAGQIQRELLRPVYWLGNWQFACLDYYRPPKRVKDCCIQAESFPPVLKALITRIERITRQNFPRNFVPKSWELNTCLVNFYGTKTCGEKTIDCARVGEHKDFEPGPVASLSFGERAIFQFVRSRGKGLPSQVVKQMWLEDSSLQIFGGEFFKERLFHRVQRVENKLKNSLGPPISDFHTRRINFTFRYVPREHFVRFSKLPAERAEDVREYVEELAEHTAFFQQELKARPSSSPRPG